VRKREKEGERRWVDGAFRPCTLTRARAYTLGKRGRDEKQKTEIVRKCVCVVSDSSNSTSTSSRKEAQARSGLNEKENGRMDREKEEEMKRNERALG